ncbi:hypothetical protein [uncultured Duncaniella sp.]|nr:hypothetical protein [uncultured Duncaniella sp.]
MAVFSCGVENLDNFFHHEVKECVDHHYLSAYCAFLNSGEIVAVFTLMNDALMIAGQVEKEDFIDDMRFDTVMISLTFSNVNHHIRPSISDISEYQLITKDVV